MIILVSGCIPVQPVMADSSEITARITYYWPGGSGQVGTKTSTGNVAKSNKTAAVDPKVIPYGSKINIPMMQKVYVAHDTGSAVVKRTASRKLGRDNIVVDIFCSSRKEASYYIKKYPTFMKIKIER